MSSQWLESEGARERVTELLYEAGIPLELEVEAICKQFSESSNHNKSFEARTEKVVYSTADEPETYREVDQLVSLYDEFDLGVTGIQLIGDVPIECKNRRDIEYFVFPLEQDTAHLGFPLWSAGGWSQCLNRLRSTYQPLAGIPSVSVVMLQIKNGEQPQNAHKEQLHYNGAGALYDFVLSHGDDDFLGKLFERENEWIIDSEIYTHINQLVSANSATLRALKSYIGEIPIELCRSFNDYAHHGRHVLHPYNFQMPILCVNGPIYLVEWEGSSGITGYVPTTTCIVQIRKQGWPGSLRHRLLNQVVEVPVILTNVDGLPECLEIASSWYQLITQTLKELPGELLERMPLEAAVYLKGIECVERQLTGQEAPYRSDVDIDRWQ